MKMKRPESKKVGIQEGAERYRQSGTVHQLVERAKVSPVIQTAQRVITVVRAPVNTRANTCMMYLAVLRSDGWKL